MLEAIHECPVDFDLIKIFQSSDDQCKFCPFFEKGVRNNLLSHPFPIGPGVENNSIFTWIHVKEQVGCAKHAGIALQEVGQQIRSGTLAVMEIPVPLAMD